MENDQHNQSEEARDHKCTIDKPQLKRKTMHSRARTPSLHTQNLIIFEIYETDKK